MPPQSSGACTGNFIQQPVLDNVDVTTDDGFMFATEMLREELAYDAELASKVSLETLVKEGVKLGSDAIEELQDWGPEFDRLHEEFSGSMGPQVDKALRNFTPIIGSPADQPFTRIVSTPLGVSIALSYFLLIVALFMRKSKSGLYVVTQFADTGKLSSSHL
jgi:hypothetical protein